MAGIDIARKKMAQEDVDLITQYTDGWNKAYAAGDKAGMDKYHQLAQGVRYKYDYSGGDDGSQYQAWSKPGGYSSGSYSTQKVQTTPQSAGSFSYPSMGGFADKYQQLIDAAQAKYLNRPAFSYDPEKDDAYKQYEASYTRQGNKAMQDTLAEISARTGGLASSYAGQAAQQTYDGYMSALADKQIDLRELAYQKYMDQYNMDRDALNVLTGLSDREYGRYLDDRNQYNTDRNFAYGQYRDAVGDNRYADETAYQREQDAKNWEWQEKEWAYKQEQDAIANELAAQQQAWRERVDQRDYDYGVQQDAIANELARRKLYSSYGKGGNGSDYGGYVTQDAGAARNDLAASVANAISANGDFVQVGGTWMPWSDVADGLDSRSIVETRTADGRVELKLNNGAQVNKWNGMIDMPY